MSFYKVSDSNLRESDRGKKEIPSVLAKKASASYPKMTQANPVRSNCSCLDKAVSTVTEHPN